MRGGGRGGAGGVVGVGPMTDLRAGLERLVKAHDSIEMTEADAYSFTFKHPAWLDARAALAAPPAPNAQYFGQMVSATSSGKQCVAPEWRADEPEGGA